VNQAKDPAAPPVPEPDNGEERLQLLKKEVFLDDFVNILYMLQK
jgi:hypothetical protein